MRARCYRCQAAFETDRFGVQTCPSCGAEVYLPDPSAPPPVAAPPPYQPPPLPGWGPVPPGAVPPPAEQSAPFVERARRGFLPSYVETWKLAALEPVRFFRQVRIGETRSAVLFGVIALTIGNWVALVFSYLTASTTMSVMAQFSRRMNGRFDTGPILEMVQGLTLGSFLGQLAATPLLAFAGLYVTAAVFHVLLLAVRGAPRGFEATLTVVGYASGIFLLRAIPACGGLVAGVWFMVVSIHGLSEAQRCGSAKSAFAVIGPLVLACLLACVVGALAGMAGWGALKGGGPPPSTGI